MTARAAPDAVSRSDRSGLTSLVAAAHPGPALAVTVLSGLLSAAQGLGPATALLVVAAVLAGQLSIGWSNDLVDVARDRRSGRTDKPVASGEVSYAVVRTACATAGCDQMSYGAPRSESIQTWVLSITRPVVTSTPASIIPTVIRSSTVHAHGVWSAQTVSNTWRTPCVAHG